MTENKIQMYLHCKSCLSNRSKDKVSVGYTKEGIQVWCDMCNSNIVHIDFEGNKHPAE